MKKSVIPVRYGVLIAIGLIVYFLILSLVGVHTNPVFSIGNGVIVALGLYKATILFTAFFAVYVTNINTDFLPEMLANWSYHYHVGVGVVVFVAAIMGFSTTFVLTLSFMQLFKESWNLKKNYKSHPIEV